MTDEHLVVLDDHLLRMRVVILDELKHLMRALHDEERAALENSIRRDGAREPLCVWDRGGDHVLLDGHNRYEICQKLGVPYRQRIISGIYSLSDAEKWMISNQLARRNISPFEKAYLIGMRYNREKAQGTRTDLTDDGTLDTAARVGADFHVSDRAVRAMGQFCDAVELLEQTIQKKAEILYGSLPLSREEIIWLASQPDEDHRDLWARALVDRKDLQKIMKQREKSRPRPRSSLAREAPPAMDRYDIYQLVKLIATVWPVGRIKNELPAPTWTEQNILSQHLDAAIASLKELAGDEAEEE